MGRLRKLALMIALVAASIIHGLLGSGTATAQAQEYPARPIQLVVAYPKGGTGEDVGQPLAERLSKILGQPVTLDFRSGASGSVGTQFVSRAAPDGYTLLLGQTGEIVINRYLVRDLGYDPEKDLVAAALVSQVPLALVVGADAPFKSVDDLLRAARSSPRGLSFSSGGPGTTGQFAGELLRLRSGATLNHVPGDGAAAALQAVKQKRVDFYFAPLPLALSSIADGSVRALAVSSSQKLPSIPSAPTLIDLGYKDFALEAWVAVFAPAKAPPQIVSRLNSAVNEALRDPGMRDRLVASGMIVAPRSVQEADQFVRSEARKYGDVIAEDFCSRFGYGGCGGYNTFE